MAPVSTLQLLLAFLPVVAFAAPPGPPVIRSPRTYPAAFFARDGGGGGSKTDGSAVVVVGLSNGSLGDNITTTGYAPERVACANGTVFVRPASDGINEDERAWVAARLASDPFGAYLSSINLTVADLNLPALNDSASSTASNGSFSSNQTSAAPVIGLAFSGGGLRAQVSGGGQLYGLDPRNAEARAAGTAFLPAVAYIAGLSGGSWLTASVAAHAPENVSTLELAQNNWNLSQNLVTDAPQPGLVNSVDYFTELTQAVSAKADASFPIGITDYWGLAVGAHLFPPEYVVGTGRPNLTMGDIAGLSANSTPYPIILTVERSPGQQLSRWLEDGSIYEWTPHQFGSWGFGGGFGNQSLYNGAFTPTKYLGTSLQNGRPNITADGGEQCVHGFDNLAFVVGSASSIFNTAYAAIANQTTGVLGSAIQSVLGRISTAELDVARVPNPFAGWRPETNPAANLTTINLVDAGLSLQNVPVEPLLAPARNVDTIIAFDNSADTEFNWPNGSSLAASQRRFANISAELVQKNFTASPGPLFLPKMPTSANAFVTGGLNSRPVFFGCSSNPTPSARDMEAPLVVLINNYPFSAHSNVSTFDLELSQNQTDEILLNGVRTVTLNGTLAGNWSSALACALADRAVFRAGNNRSTLCTELFATWCWDGSSNSTNVTESYAPMVGSVPPFLADLGVSPSPAAGYEANSTATAIARRI